LLKKVVVAVFIIVFIMNSSYLADLVKADVSRLPGVKAGDWAMYDFTYDYSSNDPNMPMEPPQFEGLEYYRLEISSVVSTNVSYTMMVHYRNGTETTTYDWIDVSSGDPHNGAPWPGLVLAANLTAGEKTYLSKYSPTINTTKTGIYAGSRRQVNCVCISQSLTLSNQQQLFDERNLCWDKTSGLCATANETLAMKNREKAYTTMLNFRLTIVETNVWKSASTVPAEVIILSRVFNVRSDSRWVLAFIELSKDYKAIDVDGTSVMINNAVSITGKAVIIGKRWLLVRFNRSDVISDALSAMRQRRFTIVTLTVTGKFKDGSSFEGSDQILIIRPPKHSPHGT